MSSKPEGAKIWTSLELTKLGVGILTPVTVAILGFVVNGHLEEQRRLIQRQGTEVQRLQSRLANRNEFQRLTLEVNKEVIRDPELDAFDHQGEPRPPKKVKLEALAYIYMNMFELVYEYYHPFAADQTAQDEKEWRVWQEVMKSTVKDSAALRDVINAKDSPLIYSDDFYKFIKGLADAVKRS